MRHASIKNAFSPWCVISFIFFFTWGELMSYRSAKRRTAASALRISPPKKTWLQLLVCQVPSLETGDAGRRELRWPERDSMMLGGFAEARTSTNSSCVTQSGKVSLGRLAEAYSTTASYLCSSLLSVRRTEGTTFFFPLTTCSVLNPARLCADA